MCSGVAFRFGPQSAAAKNARWPQNHERMDQEGDYRELHFSRADFFLPRYSGVRPTI